MQQILMGEQNHRPIFNFVAIFVGLVGTFCHGVSLVAQADPTVLQTSGRSEVPLELYNGNLLIVKATIGNLISVNVILDTGTNTNVISKKIANQLKLVETSETLQMLGSVHAGSVILPTIEFLAAVLEGRTARTIWFHLRLQPRCSRWIRLSMVSRLVCYSIQEVVVWSCFAIGCRCERPGLI